MANNPLENARAGRLPAEEPEPEAPEGAKAAATTPVGGLKPWLPLAVAMVAMPALAYATTVFVLLPKMQRALALSTSASATDSASQAGVIASAEGGQAPGPSKTKISVPLNKLLVNVAGTMGTRYLMTSLTLVGTGADFKSKIDDNRDQLMDLATGALGNKTISDLEKPSARNEIRAELMTVINNALGGPVVQEVYITEFAIQ